MPDVSGILLILRLEALAAAQAFAPVRSAAPHATASGGRTCQALTGPSSRRMGNRMDPKRERDFTVFYDATWARTVACAYAMTGVLGDAEDLAQEAYSRAWPRWSSLRG